MGIKIYVCLTLGLSKHVDEKDESNKDADSYDDYSKELLLIFKHLRLHT